MAKVTISSQKCSLSDEQDLEFLSVLDQNLSYKIQGAEFTQAYKGFYNAKTSKFVKWDGFKRLLTSKLEFPYGLFQRVKDQYKIHAKDLEIVDTRNIKEQSSPLNISAQLKKLGKEPYFYQLDALEACKKNDFGIIKIGTGGGKLLVSSLITSHFNKTTIIYVIGQDLLHQAYKFYSQLFPDQQIGLIGDGYCQISEINIASIWTVGIAAGLKSKDIYVDHSDKEKALAVDKYLKIKDLLQITKLHIFDECHMAACSTIQEIGKIINPEYLYGMSASPWRDDGADLLIESILGRKIIDISASFLIQHGFLVRPHIKFIEVPKQKNKSAEYPTIYKNYIVENTDRNALVVKGVERLVEQKFKTLVLFNTIPHGDRLYQDLKNKINCALLSGKDDNQLRQDAIKLLEDDQIQCILASKIFDIGVDIPQLSGLVLAGGGASSVRALQRVGRVTRKFPGKKISAVIDFYDQTKFLKDHSYKRLKVYQSEPEYKISGLE